MSTLFKKADHLLKGLRLMLLVLITTIGVPAAAQPGQVLVNLAGVDGLELTPATIFNYQLQSGLSSTVNAVVKGRVVFRTGGLSFSYSFPYTLRPGVNMLDRNQLHPQWTYSSQALKELFTEYGKLPAGTYEYCVEVSVPGPGGEQTGDLGNKECVYHQVDDVFLINLVDPEDDAKLYEHYPVLSWMVNYPFAQALTYKIRVAEVKKGQNNTAAVNRNNPVYQERDLRQPSVSYPVYAKPLVLNQPYAWTVDAYYKGILLGGAAPWRFTIVEDSVMKGIPRDVSFVDITTEQGNTIMYAIGKLKLKYQLKDLRTDTLTCSIADKAGKIISIKNNKLAAVYGDNRFEITLKDEIPLKHLHNYTIELKTTGGATFRVLFRYVNPDLI